MNNKKIFFTVAALLIAGLSLFCLYNKLWVCRDIDYTNLGFEKAPFSEVEVSRSRHTLKWKYQVFDEKDLVDWLFASKIYNEHHGEEDHNNELERAIKVRSSAQLLNQHISREYGEFLANVEFSRNEKEEIIIVITIVCY